MENKFIQIEKTPPILGTIKLSGAKNAALVIMASLLLTKGKSYLTNVPFSDDIKCMINLLTELGARVSITENSNSLEIDTSEVNKFHVSPDIMNKMRASILVMGPLLARFSKAIVALPGGCAIGPRPIDYHIKNFVKMSVSIKQIGQFIKAKAKNLKSGRFVLEYPSVGTTENILMASALTNGVTEIVNAALEPEVLDLIVVLKKMGAKISIYAPANIIIEGVSELRPIEHNIICDRLEAGSFILAAALTKGEVTIPNAQAFFLDVFLEKLVEMGHSIKIGENGLGIWFKASDNPKAVSFKTMPYPGFPTDLQAPMTSLLCVSSGTSVIDETVFENRFLHLQELQKMGAQVSINGSRAIIKGVEKLFGTEVIASDIRASCSLILAGLAAEGQTNVIGVQHLMRGYDNFIPKLKSLGARVNFVG